MPQFWCCYSTVVLLLHSHDCLWVYTSCVKTYFPQSTEVNIKMVSDIAQRWNGELWADLLQETPMSVRREGVSKESFSCVRKQAWKQGAEAQHYQRRDLRAKLSPCGWNPGVEPVSSFYTVHTSAGIKDQCLTKDSVAMKLELDLPR